MKFFVYANGDDSRGFRVFVKKKSNQDISFLCWEIEATVEGYTDNEWDKTDREWLFMTRRTSISGETVYTAVNSVIRQMVGFLLEELNYPRSFVLVYYEKGELLRTILNEGSLIKVIEPKVIQKKIAIYEF